MKKVMIAIALLPLAAMAQDKKAADFKLTGKMEKLAYKPEWVFIQYRYDDQWKIDSVQPVNGSYSFSGKLEEPVAAYLRVKYAEIEPGKKVQPSSKRDNVNIYIEPGKIKVSSVDSFSNVTVKGSKSQIEFKNLQAQSKPYRDKMEPLYTLYSQFARAKEDKAKQKVEEMIDSLDKKMNAEVYGEYVKKNPSSPLALYALQQYAGWDIDADKIEPVYASLSDKIKAYPSAIAFKENLDIAKKTGIGKFAMDFTQNDTLDQPVSLASLKGKYLLIDFWASWCGPCRAENPNVVRVYNKYKDKGFHILGVSLDRPGQKEKWMKAIHDDGLYWTQVSDLKFWDNEVAKQYGIRAIPQNLLLDPQGKIIAKNITGEELDQKVGEAVSGQKAF